MYDDLMTHTCYKQAVVSSQNAFGEWTESYTTGTTGIECRMSPLTAEEKIAESGRFDDVSYKGFFKSGASITLTDRIVYRSNTYKIKELTKDSEFHHIETLLVGL